MTALADARVLRSVVDALASKVDGQPAAPNVYNRKRAVLYNTLEYAVELELLTENPLRQSKPAAPQKARTAVDRRCVANPDQARALLDAVHQTPTSGPRLVAFFGAIYYAALRPEEAAGLRKHNLALPAEGWGDIVLEDATPEAGSDWTDTGDRRDTRHLKHRAADDVRHVPCPPELTALLHNHLEQFGTDTEGRLFRGERGGVLTTKSYSLVWARARERALTPDQVASPLAKRPYDLRHAAVSTWLNAGVDPTQVAEWAGHSVKVLLEVYAKCIDGREDAARRKIEAALKPTQGSHHHSGPES